MDRVRSLIPASNTIPILGHVLLKAGDGNLSLTVTDLDTEVTTSIPDVQVMIEGGVAVPGRMFADAVKRLPQGSQLAFKASAQNANCECGRIKFAVNTLPEADWPYLPTGDVEFAGVFQAGALLTAIEAGLYAHSTEETRHYLNGVYMHSKEGEDAVAFVSTDGHRLTYYEADAPEFRVGDKIPGIIVPHRSADEIVRMLGGVGEIETVSLSGNEAKLVAHIGTTRLVTKLVDGTYPDYPRVMPGNIADTATLDVDVLKGAIQRAAVFGSGATVKHSACSLSFSGDELTIHAGVAGEGKGVEVLRIDYDGPDFIVGCNTSYLLDHLANVNGRDVDMGFVDGDRGAATFLINGKGDTRHKGVQMPVRVNPPRMGDGS